LKSVTNLANFVATAAGSLFVGFYVAPKALTNTLIPASL